FTPPIPDLSSSLTHPTYFQCSHSPLHVQLVKVVKDVCYKGKVRPLRLSLCQLRSEYH
ncbi:unnamed protein product, partial [Ceratitis capitata]